MRCAVQTFQMTHMMQQHCQQYISHVAVYRLLALVSWVKNLKFNFKRKSQVVGHYRLLANDIIHLMWSKRTSALSFSFHLCFSSRRKKLNKNFEFIDSCTISSISSIFRWHVLSVAIALATLQVAVDCNLCCAPRVQKDNSLRMMDRIMSGK